MDDHAKAVAARWAKKRAEAIANGSRPDAFDTLMMNFMLWAGWSNKEAQAICNRAKQLHEKEVNECEQS